MMMERPRFVEVWDSTDGEDSEIVKVILRNMFDVRYERSHDTFIYYRLRATKTDVKLLANQLLALGYHAKVTNNRRFHIYERAN